MRLLFCLLSLFVCIGAAGQGDNKHPYKAYSFEDVTGQLSIEEVLSPKVQAGFVATRRSVLNFGFTEKIIWLKFEIDKPVSRQLVLNFEQAFLPDVQLYYQDSSQRWQQMRSGYKVPISQKPLSDHFQAFPLPANTAVFYVRLTPLMHAIPVRLMSVEEWETTAARQKMGYGIYAGILLFAVIINIFLFLALRKLYFLNYSILVFFYLLTSALVMEGYAIYFFPEIDLMYWYKVVPVLDMPAFLFYCISFFGLRKQHPRLFRFTLSCALFFCCYLFTLPYIPLMTVLLINQAFAMYVFLLGTFIGITVGRSGNKLGYLFALSYLVWFILILVEAIYIQTGKPEHLFPISYVSTAIFIEAFLLAFLQAMRFGSERKADTLRHFEMKTQLSKMQQIFQQEILNAKLEIQEQTLNSVSQEIHDNVGQVLSLAKIQVNLMSEKPHKDNETLASVKEHIGNALTDLRNIAKHLNSQFISHSTLEETISNQVEKINQLEFIQASFTVTGEELTIDNQKKLIIFRIIQESIQNIIKHAKASKVDIHLEYAQPHFHLTITDDGIGFDKEQLPPKSSGLGLQNIMSRAELIGGKASIESKIDKGTIITVSAPYV
jgi:signal transduction histidine kinase